MVRGTPSSSAVPEVRLQPLARVLRGYAGVFLVYTDLPGVGGPVNQMQVAARAALVDNDTDEVGDTIDNCLGVANPAQINSDDNFFDNSPPYAVSTDDKTDPNSDVAGDACDTDDDNDGIDDATETNLVALQAICPTASAALDPLKFDSDNDRVADGAECMLGSDPADIASRAGEPDGC